MVLGHGPSPVHAQTGGWIPTLIYVHVDVFASYALKESVLQMNW